MTIFDIMKRSRDAALYRRIYQSRMRAKVGGNAFGESVSPSPEPEPIPEPDVIVETQDDFKAALADAEAGDIIQVAVDMDISGVPLVIDAGKTVTVDINGKTISSEGLSGGTTTDAIFAVRRGGTLILEDTSDSKTGVVDGSKVGSICCAVKLTEKGEDASGEAAKVIIKSGTYIGTNYAVSGNGMRQDTDVTIEGGTFKCNDASEKGETAYYQPQRGSLTINGGEFEGPTALYIKCGIAVINGGTFKTESPAAEFNHNGNGTHPTGDAVIVEACDYPGGYPTVIVNGGTFISENAKGLASYAQTGHEAARLTKFIRGGTFSSAVDEDLIADGYQQVTKDGKYIIKAL